MDPRHPESSPSCTCPKDSAGHCEACRSVIRKHLAGMIELGLNASRLSTLCTTCASDSWDDIMAQVMKEYADQEPTRRRRNEIAEIVRGFLMSAPLKVRSKIDAELARQHALNFESLP